mgnify:FL=1
MGFDTQFLVRVRGSFLAITAFKHQYTFPLLYIQIHGWESLRDSTANLLITEPELILPPPLTTPDTLLSLAANSLASHFDILTEEQLLSLPPECFTPILHHLPPNTLLHLHFDSPILRGHFHDFVFSLQAELYYEGKSKAACGIVERDLAEEMTGFHPDVTVEICYQDECIGCEEHWLYGPCRRIVSCGEVKKIEEDEATSFPCPEDEYDDDLSGWGWIFGPLHEHVFFPRAKHWTRFGYLCHAKQL